MRVLIAGAGPTGLTLAIELARRDIAVRIIDSATTFFTGSRGDGIQPRTLEVFDDLGVLDSVLKAGSNQPLMRIHLDGNPVGERRMSELVEPTDSTPYPNPWVLGQSHTEAILRDRLKDFGHSVELGTALTGFEQDADGVTAYLSTGEHYRADYLVGADGGRSLTRKTLGIAFDGTTDESIQMLLGDVSAEGLDHDHGYWFARAADPASGIALTPLPGGSQFQFGTPLTGKDASIETLQRLLDELSGRDDVRLHDLTWSTIWRPNVRLAERFRVGRVFLAGDAAHVHPPTGGQGLNTGIQDAYNLGWKLAEGNDELLDTYETERRANAARVLGLSSELLDKHREGAEDAMTRGPETHQLDITYRTEPGTTLAAGDRAPDAKLADGRRLFDLFRGPHATLLSFGIPAPDEPHAYSIEPLKAYDAEPGDQVLVRPDGYVAEVRRAMNASTPSR